MLFKVIPHGRRPPEVTQPTAFLFTDNWDDWFKFSTLYNLMYIDENNDKHEIGGVKIGQFEMEEGQRRPDLPTRFESLDEDFFSLGQDESYYESLNRLGPLVRDEVLHGLRDFSIDLDLFERALSEDVTGVSLLRSVTKSTVRGQFHRLAQGGARLSRYEFSYTAPRPSKRFPPPVELEFMVEPESEPPTNVHVLIGRNGVGKTYLLNHMTRALVQENEKTEVVGYFDFDEDEFEYGLFSNIVSITFSAFDPFEPLPETQNKSSGVRYSYVGLKRKSRLKDDRPRPPKTHRALSAEFGKSAKVCSKGARAERWKRALNMLEADPIFKSANVAALSNEDEENFQKRASNLFGKLSSGHKIVLLTTTRLVETVEERTLVILDEPEAHLHPPLLSAFVRALSDLLINRNGVAIIATHSPVVLQEVPRNCVWKVRRTGRKVVVDRPQVETFGESVGVLTHEVFGLEVTHSGFHKLIIDCLDEYDEYDDIIEHFNGEIGDEGKAIIRSLLVTRNRNELI